MPTSSTKFLDVLVAERMSRTANGAVTAYLLVAIDDTDHTKAALVAAANANCHGVAEADAADGKEFAMVTGGRFAVRAGDTIAKGDKLVSDANGKAVPRGNAAGTTYNVIGEALTAAAADELVTVDWAPQEVAGTAEDVVTKTQADSPVALTAADHGKTFTNKGATDTVEFDLPAAPAEGICLRFVALAAQAIRLDPGASDGIYINGAKQTDGLYVDFDAVNEYLEIVANEDGDWIPVAKSGTFTVET